MMDIDISTTEFLKKTDRLKGEANSATGSVNVPGRSDAMLTVSTFFTLLDQGMSTISTVPNASAHLADSLHSCRADSYASGVAKAACTTALTNAR